MNTAQKLKEARTFRNMTQQSLSDATGISVRLIQKYEAGTRTPKNENIEKLADALCISPKALSEISIATYEDVMFMLFELEKEYGEIIIKPISGKNAICIDSIPLNNRLMSWKKVKEKLSDEEMKEWQMTYPDKELL